jgi:hypothetical protein
MNEINTRLTQIILSLLDLLGSKKFLVALAGGLLAYVETGDWWTLAGAAIAFVVAQGVADIGKERAKIEQQ